MRRQPTKKKKQLPKNKKSVTKKYSMEKGAYDNGNRSEIHRPQHRNS